MWSACDDHYFPHKVYSDVVNVTFGQLVLQLLVTVIASACDRVSYKDLTIMIRSTRSIIIC